MIFKSTTNKEASWNVDSTSKPFALLEQLEPRILLSGDGLLKIAPEPLDSLVYTMPRVVQYAELLETNEQAEEAEEQVPCELSNANIYEPLLTLSVDEAGDEGPIGDNTEVTDTKTLADDLDIALQSLQLSVVENYAYPENIPSGSEELSSDLTVSMGYDDTTDQLTEMLLAANPPPVLSSEIISTEFAVDTAITNEQLAPIIEEAINRLSAAELIADGSFNLDNVRFQIADLPTGILAQVTSDVLTVDSTASGFGWFIDSTPSDDTEFSRQMSNGQLIASQESLAYGQIDLLTVISHELGHVLGLEDVNASTDNSSLMTATLGPGIRRLPAQANVLLQEAGPISNAYVTVDLLTTIDSYLASNESGSVIVVEAKLGGFLDLFTLTLDFSGIVYTGGLYDSGIVGIATQTGELFPGSSAFVSITDGNGDDISISGTYNPGTGQFGLTLEIFELNIPSVLTASTENVTIEYNPAGASNQTLVTIGDFEMVLLVLDNTTVQVNNLIIRQDGFSVENASIEVASITWLNTLELSNFDLTLTNVNFSTTGPTLSGTIGVSATTIKLFPSQDFFTTEITTFSGSYDLGTSALSLSAEHLKIAFSDVLLIELGTASFSMDAGAGTFSALIASGTLSSPRFTDLPGISVTNLVINQSGFSFDTVRLGPINFEVGSVLTIVDFEIVVSNFNYSTSGGLVSGSVGFAFVSVGIFPGQTLFTAEIDNFSGSYDIINRSLNISASRVMIQISDLLKVTAEGVVININPFSMSFGSIVVTSPKLEGISGTLTELEITETGFSLGSAILSYSGEISAGPLTLNGLGIGIMNYEYSSVAPEPFSGSILFYSGGASLVMGGSFSAIISDTDDDSRALSATLNFEAGAFKDLQFMVDKLEVKIGTYLTFTTTGVNLDTGAVDDEFLVSFSSISASVKVGSLSLKGTAKNFGVTANGDLTVIPGQTFAVTLEIGGVGGGSFNWPSWLPIKINAIGIEFDFAELAVNPLDFTFMLSASVSGLPAVAGLEFSGTIEGLRIRPALLLEGKFPVIDIASIGVSVKGELFGGEINAALIGGILKIEETSPGNYAVIDPMDTDTEVYDRVLFMGLQGGFSMPGLGGLTIRFALSELGPLGVFINIEVPGGIVLEPHIGLAVNDFAAGVEFFKSLPSIDDPFQLRDPAFTVSTTVTADTWLASVKGQVFDQYVAMKQIPNLPGFLAAFISPMLIVGSAKIYTIYTSQQVFNGQVDLILSTDGKFMISGKLNFAADNITISGKLYADLTNIINGDVTVLFLADIPEQVRLLSIDGKLKMGFRDETGQEVEIPVVISDPVATHEETTGDLVFPGNGETIDVGVINSNPSDGRYYIDVKFQPGANQTLDYSGIINGFPNRFHIYQTKLDGTYVGVYYDDFPLPIETNIIGGVAVDTVFTGTHEELISICQSRGIQSFRYLIKDPGFEWEPGEVLVMFFVGDGENEIFTIAGPTADISKPSNVGRIEISEFEDHMYFDVTFMPSRTSGATIDTAPIDIPILSGPGLGSISIVGPPTSVENPIGSPDGSVTLRYELSGEFTTGEVTLTFAADTFHDSQGFGNTEQILSFIVDGATADLSNPGNGSSIGIDVLDGQGTIDVIFNSAWDFDIDLGTLNDGLPEFLITLSNGTQLTISDDPTGSYDLDGKTVYTYSFTGNLLPGTATVVFLDESFADISGLANIEEVETFFIDQPTAAFSNLVDGATYLNTSLNDIDAGKLVGLFDSDATGRYFELTLTPTNGAQIDESTIDFTDLQIDASSGFSIDSVTRVIEQIEDPDGTLIDSPTNRFRFYFSGTCPDQHPIYVTLGMNPNAWQDTAGNESKEVYIQIIIRKPATVLYLELEGGITLEAAGLLEEPIFEVRGHVNFEAKLDPAGPRFELEFGGTGRVVYLGNLGSMAGLFIMEIPVKFILDSHDDPAKDPDAITAGDLLTDLGLTLEPDHFLNLVQLPKLWGVVKIETNFEILKEIGIDLKAEALLELNLTANTQTETLTLEGIPGDIFSQLAASETLIDELNSETLPGDLEALFTGDNALGSGYEVRTVVGGVLWRIIDSANNKQYFIQLQDDTELTTAANPDPVTDINLVLRNETQEFVLQPKMLRVMAYGQAIFRLPAYTNPDKTEMGPEWFRMTGAFSLKLSITGVEFFQNGQLTLSPAGRKILDIRSMAVILIETTLTNPGIAGKIKLGANIEIPGVLLSGNMEAYVNTFGYDVVYEVPGFLRDVVGFDSVTIYKSSPILNLDYDPADADSPILIPDDPLVDGSPYLTIAARADLHLLGDLVMLQGAFRLSLTTEILEVRAKVTTAIKVPPVLADTLFDLEGKAAFAIDADGLYGYADLYVNSTLPPPFFAPGFDFNAEFVLEFNTASVAKDIQTYEFDKTNGNKLELVTVTLSALKLQLVAGGSLAFTTTIDPEAFVLAGRFEFLMTPSLINIEAAATVSSLLVNGNAAGAFQLTSNGLIGFIQIDVAAGDEIGSTGLTEITGVDFRMSLELAFYINTSGTDVVFNGVELLKNEVKLEASGFLEFSIGGGLTGFRIEGSLLVQANSGGFAVEVDGILTAELFDITIVRLNVVGGLVITGTSPLDYEIAGRLYLSGGAGVILDGNGFSFDAVLTMEVNTTGGEVNLGTAGILSAGTYARIHADGDLTFQAAGDTGFKLDGLFDLEVGLDGLTVAAEADFLAQVDGQTIIKLHADGDFLINHLGIAAHIELSLGLDPSVGGTGFSFYGAFIFELNTTNQPIARIGGVDVNLAAGPYIRLSITDVSTGNPAYLQFSIDGSSQNCFRIEGGATIEIGSGGLQVAADGSLKVIIGGYTLFSVDAEGALLINQYGLAARIFLDASGGVGGTGFMFTGSFILEVNLTGHFISSIAGQPVNLAAGSFIRIDIAGSLEILQLMTVNGSFELEIGSEGLNVDVDAKLSIFSVGFNVDAIGVINSKGIVFRTRLSLDTASSFIPFNNFQISGILMLEVNTTSGSEYVDGAWIPKQTARVSVLNGELNIRGLKATGSIIISAGAGGFSFTVPDTAPLTLKVGTIISAELFGHINKNGFSFTATAEFHAEAGPAYLDAEAEIRLSNSEFYFYIEGTAGLKIGKINISVNASGTVQISGTSLLLSVRGCVTVVVKICKTVTFKIGTVSPPGAAQTTPEPVLATRLSDGTLRLNIGTFAFVRGAGYSDIEDESFDITHVSGTAGGETVIVSAFGFSQTYSNIKSILVSNAASGNDFVQVGENILVNAVMNGGAGKDTLIYLGSGRAVINGGAGDDYIQVAKGNNNVLNGSTGNDCLVGGSGKDTLNGGSGDDTLSGGGGDDTLNGGTGLDIIYGDSGNDTITGGSGNDEIYGHTGNDTINGDAGDDYIEGNEGSDTIHGNSGLDVIYGHAGNDIVYGDEDRDLIYGDAGNDELHGGSGNDDIYGHTGNDTIYGDAGDDYIEGNEGQETIYGGADEDEIYGGIGEDTIYGDQGNDLINGNDDDDELHGGSGEDTIYGNQGNDIIYGDEDKDLIYGNAGNDELHGGAGNDDIYGDIGEDTIYGDQGNDVIEGNEDNDTIYGGSGNDTIYGDSGNDLIYGNEDDDRIYGGTGEDEIYGGSGEDTIYGNESNDVIEGNDDNDTIYGGSGEDTIYGNEGNDVIEGNDDNDTIYGNAGNDELHGGAGNDDIYGGTGNDTIYGDSGNDLIYGNEDDDQIYGGTGEDEIYGGSGKDTIYGDEGQDTIHGGSGDDEIYGDDGNDLIHGNSGDDLIYGGNGSDRIYGDENNDIIYGGNDADIIFGGAHDDHIYGQNGDDLLLGDDGDAQLSLFATDSNVESDDGNDHIYGGAGSDVIIGGGANDTIVGDNAEDGTPSGNPGSDILIGDGGSVMYTDGVVSNISTMDPGEGGTDNIEGNEGDDIGIGGNAGDNIYGNTDDDILLGDNGSISFVGVQLQEINTTGQSSGGADYIEGNENDDIIIGGVNGSSDTLYGNDGNDIILGDNGFIDFNADSDLTTLDLIRSAADGLGGGDYIYGNAGSDVIVGGTGGDDIHGNEDPDILIGDYGRIELLDGEIVLITTIAPANLTDGQEVVIGDDTITGNEDDDIIFGGFGNDTIDGNENDDLIFGDNAQLTTRYGETSSPRYRALIGETMYGQAQDNDGMALVNMTSQYTRPDGVPKWADWGIALVDDNSFGNDYIAGGPGSDTIFGQAGDDTIQGDGSIAGALIGNPVLAQRNLDGSLTLVPSFESASDGDDYIEGNAGNDVIFGNLGQDDIIGGSSNLFGLTAQQDGSDIIFGGAGTRTERNDLGDTNETGHARDADMILGDNGNIFRLIDTATGQYLTFGYDNYSSTLRIIPRAAELLDYTPGNQDAAASDCGGGDELHGESGDDFIYGMTGNDIIFGEGQDDDLIGGWGHDWISGGSGDDGVLGDDGRVYTSRNGTAEPLYGIDDLAGQLDQKIATSGKAQQATINITDQLKKSVNLTPFNVDPEQDPLHEALNADDIIYGGLGNDWLHGGCGDDAISGAEALDEFYGKPGNSGDYLGYDPETGTFAYYDFDQVDLLQKIEGFCLNFEAAADDGNDVLFGDLGNDWLVGGTDNDHLYGGYGTDVLNVDDNLETNGGMNNMPDADNTPGIDDTAFGGAGRDILIANTLADRLIDWTGEFNSYRVPFSIFGKFTVSRKPTKDLMEYLYDLSKNDGADQTLGWDTDPDRKRNGEPFGELGLITQKDFGWHEQTGGPRGPQAGNTTGNKK